MCRGIAYKSNDLTMTPSLSKALKILEPPILVSTQTKFPCEGIKSIFIAFSDWQIDSLPLAFNFTLSLRYSRSCMAAIADS